jgi:hypothetical protein
MDKELNENETTETREQEDGVSEEHLTVDVPTEIQAGRFVTAWGCKFA